MNSDFDNEHLLIFTHAKSMFNANNQSQTYN